MDSSISSFCETLASFLSHAESTSHALAESVQRRPIPLDSTLSSFLNRIEARVSAAASDLNLLDSMAFGTVSFEELLGHCNQVYNMNHQYITLLEDRLKSFGYVPEADDGEDGDFDLVDKEELPSVEDSGHEEQTDGSVLLTKSIRNKIQYEDIFDESLSLHNLGLSDACLATLASEESADKDDFPRPLSTSKNMPDHVNHKTSEKKTSNSSVGFNSTGLFADPTFSEQDVSCDVIKICKDDYDKLPSYMKGLASLEDMMEAVSKMNSQLGKKDGTRENYSFSTDDIGKLGLGRKGRSYLLMLVKMNRLVVETVGGAVIYRAVVRS